jgi:hypothetical protein
MRNTEPPDIRITKASGDSDVYSREKLIQSLHRSGADDNSIMDVVRHVEAQLTDGMSTRKIYRRAFHQLRKSDVPAASQYNLKSAVMALGPSGYPFERFVGSLFQAQGWDTRVGIVMPGRCVNHEVDVFALKDGLVRFTECKFRNEPGSKIDVKVAMYVHSRVRDLFTRYAADHPNDSITGYQGWLVTNSKFTTDAERYGECERMHLMSWDYPAGNGLLQLIRSSGILPITVLHSLSKKQVEFILEKGVVTCRGLLAHPDVMDGLMIEPKAREAVFQEVRAVIKV